jgi:hypothetical protein
MPIPKDIKAYNAGQSAADKRICDALARLIARHLPDAESKIWHAHPVWFLDGNPIVGYSKLKSCVRLLFWSGQSFDEPGLTPEGTFKAAEARYTAADQIVVDAFRRWLEKAREIQWDYKNIVKRKGKLERLVVENGQANALRESRDWRAQTLVRIRNIIQQAAPDITEDVKWRKPSNPAGVPVWSHNGIVCTGETYKNVVKLTFVKGASLADPNGFFNSSLEGNTRRAIDFHEGDAIDEKALIELFRAAVAMNASDSRPRRTTNASNPTKTEKPATTKPRIYSMSFARVYPMYIKKAEAKGRTKAEVDEIIRWLTGHTAKSLQKALDAELDIETFFASAPRFHPNAKLIQGVVCGVRVEDIEDETMRKVRYLDKLIDELAKGKAMEKILRKG